MINSTSNSPPSGKKAVPDRKLALRFAGSDIDGPGALMTALPGECVPFWGVPNKKRSKETHGGSGKSVENKSGYILQIRIDPVTQVGKIHNYTHTYAYSHIYTYLYSYVYIRIHTHIHTSTHMYTHTCTHTYTRTHVCSYVHTYRYT